MPNYIQSAGGYFYKSYKNGKKKRVSRNEYIKKGGMTWPWKKKINPKDMFEANSQKLKKKQNILCS